jgi:hypothetical protein
MNTILAEPSDDDSHQVSTKAGEVHSGTRMGRSSWLEASTLRP